MTLLSAGTGLGVGFQSSGSGMTYPQFVASITAKATNGSVAQDALPSGGSGSSAGKVITTLSGTPTMTLMGTPSLSVFGGGQSRYGAVARHCYPTETPYTENVGAGRAVYFDITYPGEASDYTGINRNGLLSDSSTSNPRSSYRVVQFAWWDAVLGLPQTINPFVGGAPTLYTG